MQPGVGDQHVGTTTRREGADVVAAQDLRPGQRGRPHRPHQRDTGLDRAAQHVQQVRHSPGDGSLAAVLGRTGAPGPDTDARDLLLEECARQKEAVGPNTKKLVLDLSALDRGFDRVS